jgi:hypothetical protein
METKWQERVPQLICPKKASIKTQLSVLSPVITASLSSSSDHLQAKKAS